MTAKRNINVVDFYNTTKNIYYNLAAANGEINPDRYFQLTDYICLPQRKDEMEFTFQQLVFHAQNVGSQLRSIVNYDVNHLNIEKVLFQFDANEVSLKYDGLAGIEKLRKEFEKFMKVDYSKSKNPGSLLRNYSKCIIECANYLKKFSSKKEVLNDLLLNYCGQNKNYQTLLEYFGKAITSTQYGIALRCDFLKEFDIAFIDLPKPDRHIKQVIGKLLYGDTQHYSDSKSDMYALIEDFQAIVKEINTQLPSENLTVYKLDRMIYIICSGSFFLSSGTIKDNYLNVI